MNIQGLRKYAHSFPPLLQISAQHNPEIATSSEIAVSGLQPELQFSKCNLVCSPKINNTAIQRVFGWTIQPFLDCFSPSQSLLVHGNPATSLTLNRNQELVSNCENTEDVPDQILEIGSIL